LFISQPQSPPRLLGEGDLGGEVKKQKKAKMVNIYQISHPTLSLRFIPRNPLFAEDI